MDLKEIIENAPKILNKECLRSLYRALLNQKPESDVDIDPVINSLLLLLIDDQTPLLNRHLSIAILQKLTPIRAISDILTPEIGRPLLNALPVLLLQLSSNSECEILEIIKTLFGNLHDVNFSIENQITLFPFISKILASKKYLAPQDHTQKISMLLPRWLMTPTLVSTAKFSGFRKSPSSLSIVDIDDNSAQDFSTVLNCTSTFTLQQFRGVQVFSFLKSWLLSSKEKHGTLVGDFITEDLIFAIREYCLRIIDHVDGRVQSSSTVEFQKASLVEAIELLNLICYVDSGMVHSVFPIVRRIYDHVYSSVINMPEVQDVAILTRSMQYFINHGHSVMHKPDSLYTHLFCDLLDKCYQDNYIAFEILFLIRENLSQLCYHSSVLEKCFPTFLKVLSWRPNNFLNDFLELLPAFMSHQTSLEVFYSLLDLPCLTAILIISDGKLQTVDPRILKDTSLLEQLKKPELLSMFKFLLRKNSGIGDTIENIGLLHQTLVPLASNRRVMSCIQAAIPLLKCYFSTLLQYADMSITVLLIQAILERISHIFPAQDYSDHVQQIFAEALLQLFEKHPEAVFHCQKYIVQYICRFKNYFTAKQNFIHLIWAIGEYASVAYSSICTPEIITLFFENLECTTYEALSALHLTVDESFLKFLSISLTTLSQLASRNQDQIPRAILCLSKTHKKLASFENGFQKSWKAVLERILELLAILNAPNAATVVLSPPKNVEQGRMHKDPTSLSHVLKVITEIFAEEKPTNKLPANK